jgi:multisubunit Na+/H+ antiporter MnhB subunit
MKYKIAAIILSIILVLLIGVNLIDFTAFTLGDPASSPLPLHEAIADWLWSYRVVDVLVQVTLLFAAVLGASAMFRAMKKEEV